MTEKYSAWVDSSRFPTISLDTRPSAEPATQAAAHPWDRQGDIDDFIFSMEEEEWSCSSR